MKRTLLSGLIIAACTLLYSYDLPKGWFKAGSDPDKYEMGVDKGAGRTGGNAATIQSNAKRIHGFGTLMQQCLPGQYLGKRVRMSGWIKSADVDSWAGLWFRVDGADPKHSLAFDNMYDRCVKGTSDWKEYEIILDVPATATNLAYGALLHGRGQIWFDNIKFEIVDPASTKTNSKRLPAPENLDFNEK